MHLKKNNIIRLVESNRIQCLSFFLKKTTSKVYTNFAPYAAEEEEKEKQRTKYCCMSSMCVEPFRHAQDKQLFWEECKSIPYVWASLTVCMRQSWVDLIKVVMNDWESNPKTICAANTPIPYHAKASTNQLATWHANIFQLVLMETSLSPFSTGNVEGHHITDMAG